jgi:hypothetical protein
MLLVKPNTKIHRNAIITSTINALEKLLPCFVNANTDLSLGMVTEVFGNYRLVSDCDEGVSLDCTIDKLCKRIPVNIPISEVYLNILNLTKLPVAVIKSSNLITIATLWSQLNNYVPKFFFIRVPHSASTAIMQRIETVEPNYPKSTITVAHYASIYKEQYSDKFSFAIARDPIHQIISRYCRELCLRKTKYDPARLHHMMQTNFPYSLSNTITTTSGDIGVKLLIPYDSLEIGLRFVEKKIGINFLPLLRMNQHSSNEMTNFNIPTLKNWIDLYSKNHQKDYDLYATAKRIFQHSIEAVG